MCGGGIKTALPEKAQGGEYSMEYIMLSADTDWEFTNEFYTTSLTYEGANVW